MENTSLERLVIEIACFLFCFLDLQVKLAKKKWCTYPLSVKQTIYTQLVQTSLCANKAAEKLFLLQQEPQKVLTADPSTWPGLGRELSTTPLRWERDLSLTIYALDLKKKRPSACWWVLSVSAIPGVTKRLPQQLSDPLKTGPDLNPSQPWAKASDKGVKKDRATGD